MSKKGISPHIKQEWGLFMDRRVIKTREAIQRSYFELLKQKQGDRITVAEVTRNANIDRKTFYLHYTCIDDVWNNFCDEKIEELLESLRKTDFWENPIHIKTFFIAMNEVFEKDMDSIRFLSNSFLQSFCDKVNDILVEALLNKYSERVTVSKERMKIYCEFLVSGMIHLYQEFLTDSDKLTTDQIERVVVHIAMKGIMDLIKTDPAGTKQGV